MADSYKIFFLLICLCNLPAQFHAQTVEPKFDTFPATIAHAFHQDSLGFIWIGTQEGLLRYDGYTFKHYNHIPFDSTSLSNDWVLDIEEDHHGNLWIGTFGGGLNYFDQKTEKFTRFSGSAENNQNAHITKIIVNDDGSLWFSGSMHSLTHLKPGLDGKPDYTHYDLFDEPIIKSFPTKNSAQTLHQDKQGTIWIGMATEGLIRFDPVTEEKKQYKHDPDNPHSISHNTISSICEDDSGNIWIGTGHPNISRQGGGLNMYDRKTEKFKHFKHDWSGKNSICSDNISKLLIDETGTMWIGTWNNYINTVPLKDLLSENEPFFNHYTNIVRSTILSLYEDCLGNIWIGVMTMQSHKFDRQQNSFALFSRNDNYPNSLTQNATWTVYADHSGSLWFGTNGLDVYDTKTGNFKHFYHDLKDTTGLSSDMISGIQEDPEGNVWIATWHDGINILNPESGFFKHIRHSPNVSTGLGSNSILFLLARKNGDFWIASQDAGIQLYEHKTGNFYTYDVDPETNEDFLVSSLCEDRGAVLWIGTFNSGIYSLHLDEHQNPEIFHYYNDPQNLSSLSCNDISDIIQPSIIDTNALWIATKAGLNRFDLETKSFAHFFKKDGMSGNLVLKILEDNQGDLWCTTMNGLSVYKIKTGDMLNYSKGDGMPFESFGGFRQNAAKDLDGCLYFAGGNGVLSFFPQDIHQNPNIPPIRIIDFSVFPKQVKLDTTIQYKRSIILDYNQNMFSFDFAALNFTNPEKNQYAYKMEGLLDEWFYIGNEHTASFTNLDPGEYVFHVKGSNNHGIWNEEGTAIRVIIIPPWWKTGGAYFAYTILLGTFLIGTIRFEVRRRQRNIENHLQRERELRKLDEAEHRAVVAELQRKTAEAQQEAEKEYMRSRIASDLHDEIGSNLSSIALISQIVEGKLKLQPPLKIRMQEIPRIARLTAESMRDIVWFINPENDDIDKLLAKMRETANLMLETVGFTFTAPEKDISMETDLDFRRNLYLFYKECLQNIIKHSNSKKVRIEIQKKDKCLQLRVADDGIGFDASQEYGGSGLKNLQRRAADMGGEMQITSEIGKGTTIMLTANIP